MKDDKTRVDATVMRIDNLLISRDPDMHHGLGMLLTVVMGGFDDQPVTIGFSREATQTLYRAMIETPPPTNRTLPHRH